MSFKFSYTIGCGGSEVFLYNLLDFLNLVALAI